MRGPLGIRRAARTRVVVEERPSKLSGIAEVGPRTVARVSWTLRPQAAARACGWRRRSSVRRCSIARSWRSAGGAGWSGASPRSSRPWRRDGRRGRRSVGLGVAPAPHVSLELRHELRQFGDLRVAEAIRHRRLARGASRRRCGSRSTCRCRSRSSSAPSASAAARDCSAASTWRPASRSSRARSSSSSLGRTRRAPAGEDAGELLLRREHPAPHARARMLPRHDERLVPAAVHELGAGAVTEPHAQRLVARHVVRMRVRSADSIRRHGMVHVRERGLDLLAAVLAPAAAAL